MPHLDELARLSFDPNVPADERQDANAELYNVFGSALPYADMGEVRAAVDMVLADQEALAKATRLEAYRARAGSVERYDGRGHTSVLYLNEYGVVDGMAGPTSRYLEKPMTGGFNFLRRVVAESDIIKAIILTVIRHIISHAVPERDQSPLGFHLVRKDGEKLNKDDRKETERLEEILINSGDESDPRKRKRKRRENMRGFLFKLLWDSLSLDACPVELEPTRNGKKISGWYNVPGDSIRLCSEEGYEGDDEIFAVQLIDEIPHVAYTYDDLIYEVRNLRTDLRVGGYGYAEPEMIVRAVTAFMNAFAYNAAGLDKNSIPRSILALFGSMFDRRELTTFTNQAHAMLHGGSNRWKMPIVAFPNTKDGDIKHIPIDTNFNELHFARWMTLNVSIPCAIYGFDPQGIGFENFSAHNTSPLNKGSDTELKVDLSRNKILIPTFMFVQGIYNDYLLPPFTDKYRLEFIGVHKEDEAKKFERQTLTLSENELRALDGVSPHPNKIIGEAPAGNPPMLALYSRLVLGNSAQEDDEDPDASDREENDDQPRRRPRRARRRLEAAEPFAKSATGKGVVVIERGVS